MADQQKSGNIEATPDMIKGLISCLGLSSAIATAIGLCLTVMGIIKHYLIDSWLVSVGVGLIVAFPILGVCLNWMARRLKKRNAEVDEKYGVLKGD